MNTRQESNFEIIQILTEYLIQNPQLRFGQALVNLEAIEMADFDYDRGPGFLDPFYEEPEETLKRMKKKI